MVTLSLNFMILYRCQFGTFVSPLPCWRCFTCCPVGACFLPSFLHSSCWMARWFVGAIPQPTVGHPVQPGLNARRDPVPLRGASVFLGGWGFFPSPLAWVRTRAMSSSPNTEYESGTEDRSVSGVWR